MRIKAGHINNLTDARYFAAWGVYWLGLDMREGVKSALSVTDAKEIMEWIEGPRFVGEFGDSTPEFIAKCVNELGLKSIQVLKGHNFLPDILSTDLELIIEPTEQERSFGPVSQETEDEISLYRLSTIPETAGWTQLMKSTKGKKIIIRCPNDIEALVRVLETERPDAIEILGSEEEETGLKSFDHLDPLLEWLEANDEV